MKLSKGNKLLILGILLVVIDQIIKVLVKTNMHIGQHIYVIGNWFQILFIENEGMAFGMKFGGAIGKFLLSFFRIGLFAALCWWISSLVKKSVDEDGKPALLANGAKRVPTGVLIGLTLITAGAFGNIIDSLFYGLIFDYAPFMFGRVVDMFYFPLIHNAAGEVVFFSPVFNFADSCVTVGAFYLVLFQWKFFASDDKKKEQKAE